ncbi:MAG: SDR family oxidoreductase [Melioribacteraceae bacterium]|nr:SDR family oxidoreductase [Melioribacteraceae bacterium]
MKTALVTGANKGIGFEVVKQLLERKFNVILTSRNTERGLSAIEKLSSFKDHLSFVQMDVGDEESIKKAVKTVVSNKNKIDVIVNNAGVLLDTKTINEASSEKILTTFKINTLGPILVIQNFLPLMNENGRIINVSSGLGAFSEMSSYAPSYSISKAGLNAVTKQFSFSLEDKNISVNSVSPGWVKTDMGGINAVRTVEKGAETIVWLADEAPQKLTGKFFRDKKEIDW